MNASLHCKSDQSPGVDSIYKDAVAADVRRRNATGCRNPPPHVGGYDSGMRRANPLNSPRPKLVKMIAQKVFSKVVEPVRMTISSVSFGFQYAAVK